MWRHSHCHWCLYVIFLSVLKIARCLFLWCCVVRHILCVVTHFYMNIQGKYTAVLSRCHSHKCDMKESRLTPVCKLQLSHTRSICEPKTTNTRPTSIAIIAVLPTSHLVSCYISLIPLIVTWPVSHRGVLSWGWGGVWHARWDGIGWGRVGLVSSSSSRST